MHEPQDRRPPEAASGSGPNRNVVAFWRGRPLSHLRRVCLASQVKQGYAVTLYSYDPVKDLPDGVVNGDAETVLPLAFKDKLQRVQTRHDIDFRVTLQLGDLFRCRALKRRLGVWLDTDLYLFRPMAIDAAQPYFAWESFFQIGNSVFYLPADHPILDAYEALIAQDELIPDWIGLRHRLKLWLWRLTGRPFTPSDLKLSLFGPMALTTLARRTGAAKYALPRRSFYAIHAQHARFFEASGFTPLFDEPQVIGVHVSPKRREHEMPAPGSLYEWAARNVGMLS